MPGLKRDNTRSPDWPPAKQTCGLGTRKCVARLPYSLAGQACTAEPAGPAGAHQRVLDVQRVALQRGVAALQRGGWVARLALHLVVLVCLVGIGLHGQRPADAALLRVAQHLRAHSGGASPAPATQALGTFRSLPLLVTAKPCCTRRSTAPADTFGRHSDRCVCGHAGNVPLSSYAYIKRQRMPGLQGPCMLSSRSARFWARVRTRGEAQRTE